MKGQNLDFRPEPQLRGEPILRYKNRGGRGGTKTTVVGEYISYALLI